MCYRFDILNWGYYISIWITRKVLLFRKYSNNKSLNGDKQEKGHPRYWERHLQQKWLPGQSAALIHITTRTTQNQLVQSWNSWQTVKLHFCLLWLFSHVLFHIRMTLALTHHSRDLIITQPCLITLGVRLFFELCNC